MEVSYLDKGMKAGQLCAATIGFFDGVHQGHRYLLRRLVDEARQAGLQSCVITFDRHPRQVLQADYCPRLLTTFEERIELLSKQESTDASSYRSRQRWPHFPLKIS